MSVAFRSRRRAQSIIETVVGIIFLIPIVLFLFDVGVLVLANTANDNLAKQAARAASSATPAVIPANPLANIPAYRTAAGIAAQRIITNYGHAAGSPGFVTNVTLDRMEYNGGQAGQGNVAVRTHMLVRVPVPFPGFNTARDFFARAVEPIVSLPPQ